MRLCKHHFIKYVKFHLRKEFRSLFRHSDMAYGSMDPTGTGKITAADFMNSMACKRFEEHSKMFATRQNGNTRYSCFRIYQADLVEFFNIANLFDPSKGGTMSYQSFKKVFFPQFCHALAEEREGNDLDSRRGDEDRQAKERMDENGPEQSKIIQSRIVKIEKALRQKMGDTYESVRKAFLALDSDHDGFITIEDFLRSFGDKDFSYTDLKKLIESKDDLKKGKISYENFSAWVGGSIHMSEGFYFRHDSVKNP